MRSNESVSGEGSSFDGPRRGLGLGFTPALFAGVALVLGACSQNVRGACVTCDPGALPSASPSSTATASPSGAPSTMPPPVMDDPMARLKTLLLPKDAKAPVDVTNRYADDPRAAALGKKFFYETRFSGPLLDQANNGTSGTLGMQGETGKVGCVSCHVTDGGAFADLRSPRQQLSLGSGWTHRKAPSILDVAQGQFFMWDGRRDSVFSQVFSPIESPLEFNSSRLFVAQQVARLYRAEYEAVFGAMPDLSKYPALDASQAGCSELPSDPVSGQCGKPGDQDEPVTRVVANLGKAVQAFTRTLSCGRSRFDEWLEGTETALSDQEKAGALLFVGKAGCSMCHSGPYLTDGRFHNVGLSGGLVPFTGVATFNDPGAAPAVAVLLKDPLNSRGVFSDGDDRRLDKLPADPQALLGSFKTPGLRCVSRRGSFMHNAEFRSLGDVVDFFNEGASSGGFVGVAENAPRNLSREEREQLVAFLTALDGSGPDPAAMVPPTLAP
ncbi:MAG TPA: cytochrome c peroxidase [Polyangiaceae bacterium]|nr:cytochrome c peroxidase [Polyangiaceae bacterium]